MTLTLLSESPLTVHQLARELGVTPRQVYGWAGVGVKVAGQVVKLEAVKLGGRLRTSREALERFLARCSPEPDQTLQFLEERKATKTRQDAARRELRRRLGVEDERHDRPRSRRR
jgi:hypothetical protein